MNIDIPSKGIWDHVRGLFKIVISLVPYVGGAGAEIIEQAVPSPVEKKRVEWMKQVSDRVIRLEGNSRPVEFSAAARRLAKALVEQSHNGRYGDPQFSQDNVRTIVGGTDDKIAETACELEEQGLVSRSEAFGMGSLGFV